MSPRPKFGEGFFNPLETDIESMDTWLPVTPVKPIPTVLVDKYGNRLGHENLHELAECYGGLETRNYDGAVHNPRSMNQEVRTERHYGGDGHGTVERTRVINHIARQVNRSGGVGCSSSLFEHLWAVKNAAANSTQSRSTTTVSLVSNSHSQVDNWRDFESANLLLQEQAHCLGSNTLSNGDSFHHISQVSDNSQLSLEANMSREQWSRPERDRDKDLLESQLVENVVQLAPGDKSNLDSRGHQVIDLNETPQQKPPKRRKHRPKVVVENKPKRTPKPMPTPKNAETKENITGKRKYVRKKPLKENGTPSQPSQTTTSGGPVVKSCKRALNFDSERTRKESQYETLIGQQQECSQRSKMTFNLNLDAQATELDGTSSGGFPKSTTVIGQQNGLSLENQQLKIMSNNSTPVIGQQNRLQMENQHWERMANMSTPVIDQQNGLLMENQQWRTNTRPTPLMNHILPNYVSFPERKVEASSIPQRNGIQAPNFEAMLRNVDVRTANPLQLSGQHQYNSTQAMMHANGVRQAVLQGRMGSVNNERIRQVIPPSTPHLAPTNYFLLQEGRGNKRNHYNAMEQTHPHAANLMGSSSADMLRTREHQRNSSIHNGSSLDANKKKRLNSGYNLNVNGMPCGIEVLHGGPTPVQTTYAKNVSGNLLTPQRNFDIVDSLIGSNNISRSENTAANSCLPGQYAQSMASSHYLPRQHTIPEQLTFKEKLGEINRLNPVHNIASLTTNENLVPPTPQNKAPVRGNKRGPKPRSANVSVKEGAGTTVAKSVLSRGRPAKQSSPDPIDELVEKFERVYISARVENAIVPYNGDRSVVPYDGDKRRKPRPKVDLDPETNRIWKLLMANEGSECFEEADKEKQKWWEEERGVFKLRAESFIAKMHLVQGDRRFSKWKGSVVDSVIGVFLTQNVSDHLSSSAFMCLAAKFPPKKTCSLSGTKISTDEPEVCVLNPNENTQGHELVLLRQPIWGQSPRTLNRSVDHQKGGENSEIEQTSSVEAFSPSLEDGVLSSQGSFTSLNLQGSGGIRSSSGSNSEAEDPVCGWKPEHDLGLTNFLHMENFNLSQESHDFLNQSLLFQEESGYGHNGLDNTNKGKQKLMPGNITDDDGNLSFTALLNSPYILDSQLSSKNCTYAGLCFNSSPLIGPLAEDVGETIPQIAPNSICGEIPTPTPHALFTQQPMQQQNIPWPANHVEAPANVQSAHETPKAAAKAFDIQEGIYGATEQPQAKSNLGKSNSREQGASTPKAHDKANTPKANKGKADREKNAFDWDSLRKEAQRKKTQRERSEYTMDSLDYEAMRRARVEDISGTIRARGMNNMLAERIKDFLDRLVNEHGSIDLEWLRDVPPEKAKDYLLSIRGLGLKSVECVRLLTLHHLAFPVDTNVGRIAVRLGWVPLQPLPESLQIHLLELYPLLETIQKYLWPRLCTLDQPTLYELHYQLITFGKVFCTKSKPNCNACPMRGECRHFASAFASARLALPGPEERGIVRSTAPIAPERHHASVNNPMLPLPPPAENSLRVSVEGSGIRNCEPIIEEPPSPEPEAQHTELTQADIEDLFWEEPDDGIPEIKISPEQLASTVQDVIQEDGRLQEADLSRALVAIDPTDPFIPTPQLKLLSRLRTEHLVYELPDTHPLLEGMDIRERDDPSPYLLAIWASGEKFDLNPPPQKECKIHELGQLCNVETCAPCNGAREADLGIVRGTILIPCRTAMQGSFPLNGTYFQVNEVFADHDTSIKPVNVPRDLIWNLPRRVVHFGTSVTAVFRGLPTDKIQQSFWRGFICVRAFERSTGAPRPLVRRLHQIPSQKKKE